MNYEVLGGYLSPAHGNYCRKKLGDNFITTEKRLDLCYLAVDEFDWLMVDLQECQMNFPFKKAMPDLYSRIKAYCHWLRDTEFYVRNKKKILKRVN